MSSNQHTITFSHTKGNRGKGKHSLVQIYPLDLGRGPINLAPDRTTIGRSGESDLRITDESVSRQHAEIRITDQGSVILDLQSTNGVYVNGSIVEVYPLTSGDRIQLGNHVFRFLANDDLEAQYHETVYSMMTRDGLTNVYNQRYLEETLAREVARCKRHARPIAAIMIEIDDYQLINDMCGHMIGDQVLSVLAQRLQSVLRSDDVLARFSTETFTVLMVESNLENAAEIAERCRVAVESKPCDTTIGPVRITISLGVAAPNHGDIATAEELLNEAVDRLHEAKRGGRNRTVC